MLAPVSLEMVPWLTVHICSVVIVELGAGVPFARIKCACLSLVHYPHLLSMTTNLVCLHCSKKSTVFNFQVSSVNDKPLGLVRLTRRGPALFELAARQTAHLMYIDSCWELFNLLQFDGSLSAPWHAPINSSSLLYCPSLV